MALGLLRPAAQTWSSLRGEGHGKARNDLAFDARGGLFEFFARNPRMMRFRSRKLCLRQAHRDPVLGLGAAPEARSRSDHRRTRDRARPISRKVHGEGAVIL